MRIRARHYATGDLVDVVCSRGSIAAIELAGAPDAETEAGWIAPAFFDLQINGCDEKGFSSKELTEDDVHHIVRVCRRRGIVALFPTLVTNSFAALHHGFATIARACDADRSLAYAIPGVHLEGPYISPEDGPRGAHSRQHVRPPNWDEFRRLQEASGNRIRLVTLAPEWPEAIPFIEKLAAENIVVAIGHTSANGEQIRAAVAAGARLSTHLGNGAHAVLPRHDNYIWEQLANDDLWASLICDGHHLPPAVVKCMVRGKTPGHVILTCDASSLAGAAPGRYRQWDQDFEVLEGGKVVVSGTSYLAGSGHFTDLCVGNVIDFAGVTLQEAVDMAGAQPRRLLGLPPRKLDVGQPADLILFDWEMGKPLRVHKTILAGN